MEPTRIGLVGCGAVVQNNYARALPGIQGLRVVAVHDLDLKAAADAAMRFGAVAMDFDSLCDRVDAVIIATPPSSHLALVLSCVDRGLTVVCEKPFVSRASEAAMVVSRSQEKDVPVFVGHLRRTFPSVRLARDLIASGAFGKVQRLQLIEGGRFAWDTSSNYVANDVSGGVLFDTGSHTVDMGLFISGLDREEFEVRVSRVSRDRAEPSHELKAEALLDGGYGTVGLDLHVSRHRVLANRVRVVLERGTVDVSVGPRDRVRVSGPLGSAVLPTGPLAADFNGYFTEQFVRIFVERRADEFRAARFVGLTKVLEAIASAQEAK